MTIHFERAKLLYGQSRYEMSLKELQQALAESLENVEVYTLMALCLSALKKSSEAIDTAKKAISFAPDWDYPHSVLAHVLSDDNQIDAALLAIKEAIRLNPDYFDYFTKLSHLYCRQELWDEALTAATMGLQMNPESVDCLHNRGVALWKLGRFAEAKLCLNGSLALYPEHKYSYCNLGWIFLEEGKPSDFVLEYFQQALRIDPNFTYAHEGILAVLKAKNPIYRMMMPYRRWILHLGRYDFFGYITCLLFIGRLLFNICVKHPWVWLVTVPYFIFIILALFSEPLLNLLLQLDPYGRLVISQTDKETSLFFNFVTLPLLILIILWVMTGNQVLLLGILIFALVSIFTEIFNGYGKKK
jgi:tetratricopeptide (TPR) repeat protein